MVTVLNESLPFAEHCKNGTVISSYEFNNACHILMTLEKIVSHYEGQKSTLSEGKYSDIFGNEYKWVDQESTCGSEDSNKNPSISQSIDQQNNKWFIIFYNDSSAPRIRS